MYFKIEDLDRRLGKSNYLGFKFRANIDAWDPSGRVGKFKIFLLALIIVIKVGQETYDDHLH